ncbi:hypothetical protein Acaty_c0907 [Acidithiobacillus caldus ATCC 51756]|uniref:Uncharacterized protein n=1 Tax=Acidithiobacillus caldus (strain ATCC 51756 / DSM 8584 / KU) TaxID=637389 RepID=A0A059ZTK3_ACICK|nr:hypothetical protein Acaty_c0907 [Acidithiobacillus caldus ATCC 51756]
MAVLLDAGFIFTSHRSLLRYQSNRPAKLHPPANVQRPIPKVK